MHGSWAGELYDKIVHTSEICKVAVGCTAFELAFRHLCQSHLNGMWCVRCVASSHGEHK